MRITVDIPSDKCIKMHIHSQDRVYPGRGTFSVGQALIFFSRHEKFNDEGVNEGRRKLV